eukprot:Hpha_TRINITY_DN1114_c0_g1::TRINITY_DN1114_c0_g1_i1::g.113169::m.113169
MAGPSGPQGAIVFSAWEEELETGDWFPDKRTAFWAPECGTAEANGLRRSAAAALRRGDLADAVPQLRALLRVTSARPGDDGSPSMESRGAEGQRRKTRAAALRGLAYVAAEEGKPSRGETLLRRAAALAGEASAAQILNQLRLRTLCGAVDPSRDLLLAERAIQSLWAEEGSFLSQQEWNEPRERRAVLLLMLALRERALAAGRLAVETQSTPPCREVDVVMARRRATQFYEEAEEFGRRHHLPQLGGVLAQRREWVQQLAEGDEGGLEWDDLVEELRRPPPQPPSPPRQTPVQNQPLSDPTTLSPRGDSRSGTYDRRSSPRGGRRHGSLKSPSASGRVSPRQAARAATAAAIAAVDRPSRAHSPRPRVHRVTRPSQNPPTHPLSPTYEREISAAREAASRRVETPRETPRDGNSTPRGGRGFPRHLAAEFARQFSIRRSSFFEYPPGSGKQWFLTQHGVAEPAVQSTRTSVQSMQAVPRSLREEYC